MYVGTAGTFTMNNCTLTGNKASANGGGGVYVGSKAKKFTMKGSSCITPSTGQDANKKGNNDVFLTESKKINLIDTLTGTSPVARITVGTNKYKEGEQVLDGDITKGAPPNQNYTKFTVTRGGSPQKNWYVGNDGKLTNDLDAIFDSTTKEKIKALESAMSNTQITDRKAKLLNKLILYKTSENNYGIMHVTAVDDTIPGSITFSYKTFNSVGSIKQSDNNHTEAGTNTFDLDSGISETNDGREDFWLENGGGKQHFTPKNSAKFYVLP